MRFSSSPTPLPLATLLAMLLAVAKINVSEATGIYPSATSTTSDDDDKMNEQEFLNKFLEEQAPVKETELPEFVDWRRIPGRVGPVRDQGKGCNSAWAFAAVGALEGFQFNSLSPQMSPKEHDESLIELSVQNLLDCDTINVNGCEGGLISDAFKFIVSQNGINMESDYPYEMGLTDVCRFKRTARAMVGIERALVLPSGDEETLKRVVANYGPVAAHIHSSVASFEKYKSGVYKSDYCGRNSKSIYSDAALIVGYGTDPEGGDYWLIKLSRGVQFGMRGYMKLARNYNNLCGIATHAVVPVFSENREDMNRLRKLARMRLAREN